MGIPFPSNEFFSALQKGLNSDPGCTDHLPPNEAYCGFSIGEHLFVLEFDGHTCSAVLPGGNELDLDFVLAGPAEVWEMAIRAVGAGDASAELPALVEKGKLEIRSVDPDGFGAARDAMPFLQVFLDKACGLEVDFEGSG